MMATLWFHPHHVTFGKDIWRVGTCRGFFVGCHPLKYFCLHNLNISSYISTTEVAPVFVPAQHLWLLLPSLKRHSDMFRPFFSICHFRSTEKASESTLCERWSRRPSSPTDPSSQVSSPLSDKCRRFLILHLLPLKVCYFSLLQFFPGKKLIYVLMIYSDKLQVTPSSNIGLYSTSGQHLYHLS